MGYKYERRSVETWVPTGAECDRCGADIPRLPFGADNLSKNLDGGLIATVDGWYGGLIDPIGDDPDLYHSVLCDNCGRELLDEFFPQLEVEEAE